MNVTRDDLKRLRLPLVVAAIMIVAGAAALLASQSYLDSARTARDGSRASRKAAQERVLRVSEEEREIRENLVDYERMRERGMIGEQSRIEWIEAISSIKKNRKLFEIKYSIDAQRGLDYPGVVSTGTADFVVSRVKLEMLLLHENDLLDFLADFEASKKAYVSARQCLVTRIDRAPSQSATSVQPRLRAECQIDLVSVKGIRPT